MATLSPPERTQLRDALKRLLADKSKEADVRRVMEEPRGYDPALWAALAEMGVVGLLAPEECGGAGAGPIEMEIVMEEAGAALLCSPLLSSGVLAVAALNASGDRAAQMRLAPAIADGTHIATLAFTGPRGSWTEEGVDVRAARKGDAWALNGVADYVTHAQCADVLLVIAITDAGTALFEVAPDSVEIAALPTFDHTLRMAKVTFTDAPARLIGAEGAGWAIAEAALAMARVALAGDQAGGGARLLDMTVEYAKTRVQFGRQIGSFQAIKHMAADLLLESESSISAARAAAQALADGAPDAPAAISLAAFACADAYVQIAATSVQMHGGIAFTWDHPAHLYLRRARADARLFGAPDVHRERYIRQLEG
jgi:alkylation response protein AidB-like acyl-CoA dehydrogenase